MDLLELPFDQYGRHSVAQDVAAILRQELGKPALRVLDVGGHPCLTPLFLPRDCVVVADVHEDSAGYSAYVRASGTALPFADASFDLVVSLDSLEHVPPSGRQAYVEEMLRVASGYALISAPFYREATALAEDLVYEFVKVMTKLEQPALREHRENGLPRLEELTALLGQRGLAYVDFDSGYVYDWLLMMVAKHYLLTVEHSETLHRALDRFYNTACQESERRIPGYRHVVLVATREPDGVLEEVRRRFSPHLARRPNPVMDLQRLQQFHLLAKLLDLRISSHADEALRAALEQKEAYISGQRVHIADLERHNAELQRRIADLERHNAELERRAADLEGALAEERELLRKVGEGRVMRLLNAIQVARGKLKP